MSRRLPARIGFALLVALVVLWSVFPLHYAVISSFRQGSELFEPAFLAQPDLTNYVAVFRGQPFGRNILNSVAVAFAVVALSLALGVTAAYALGRLRFRGRGLLLAAILSASMFPQVAVLSGTFELIRWLGLYNTLPALVLANMMLTLPFTVWVLTVFMRELPKEIEEAARVDGATHAEVLWHVFLPLPRGAHVSGSSPIIGRYPAASVATTGRGVRTVTRAGGRPAA